MVKQTQKPEADYYDSGNVLYLHNVEMGMTRVTGTDRKGYVWSEVVSEDFGNESMEGIDECPDCGESFLDMDVVEACPNCGKTAEAMLLAGREVCDICKKPEVPGFMRGGADGNGLVCGRHTREEPTPTVTITVDDVRAIIDHLINLNVLRRPEFANAQTERLVGEGNALMDRFAKLLD